MVASLGKFVAWVGDAKKDTSTRIAALKYLQASKSTAFAKSVDAALTDSEPRLRAVARDFLTALDDKRAAQSLTQVLDDAKSQPLRVAGLRQRAAQGERQQRVAIGGDADEEGVGACGHHTARACTVKSPHRDSAAAKRRRCPSVRQVS